MPHYDYASVSELAPVGHIRLRAGVWTHAVERAAPLLAAAGLSSLLPASICASTGVRCRGHDVAPLRADTRALLDRHYAEPNSRLLRLLRPERAVSRGETGGGGLPPPPPPQWKFACPTSPANANSSLGVGVEFCAGADALKRVRGGPEGRAATRGRGEKWSGRRRRGR